MRGGGGAATCCLLGRAVPELAAWCRVLGARSLAEAGHLRADPCRLGIDVDRASRVVDREGAAWPDLFVAGPLARGTHGELMGLPQVTTQPREVAEAVARLAGAGPHARLAAAAASVRA